MIIGTAIAIVYYYNPFVHSRFVARSLEIPFGLKDIGVSGRFSYYVSSLIVKEIGTIFFLVALFPLIVFFKAKKNNSIVFYLWISVPFFLLSLGPYYYQYEYIIPVVPAVAVITAVGALEIRQQLLRRFMVGLLICVCLIQYVLICDPGFRAMFFSVDHNTQDVYSVFNQLGQKRNKIAFLTDKQTLESFYGVGPLLAICSQNKAKVDIYLTDDFTSMLPAQYDFMISGLCDMQKDDNILLNNLSLKSKNYQMSQLVFFPFYGFSEENIHIYILGKKKIEALPKIGQSDNFYVYQIRNYFAFYRDLTIFRVFRSLGYNPEDQLSFIERFLLKENFSGGNFKTVFNEVTFLSRKYRKELQYEKALDFLEILLGNELIREQKPLRSLGGLGDAFFYHNAAAEIFTEIDEVFISWKNPQKAIDFLSKQAITWPNNKEINLRLARQYKILRDYKNSKKYFKRVLEIGGRSNEAISGIKNADFFLLKN